MRFPLQAETALAFRRMSQNPFPSWRTALAKEQRRLHHNDEQQRRRKNRWQDLCHRGVDISTARSVIGGVAGEWSFLEILVKQETLERGMSRLVRSVSVRKIGKKRCSNMFGELQSVR